MGAPKAAFYSLAASGLLIYFTLKIPSLAGDMLGGGGISIFSPSAVAAPVGSALNKASKPAIDAAGNYIGGKASVASTVMREMVNRATRSSGAGSISGVERSVPNAQFPRSRRPVTSSMQSMLEKGK
jgi:hypothetical protein